MARAQYNLVRPGEEAYAILPTRPPPRTAAKADAGSHPGWISRTWSTVTSIF